MTIKIKYNVYFRTACIALFSLIFTSCTKDKRKRLRDSI